MKKLTFSYNVFLLPYHFARAEGEREGGGKQKLVIQNLVTETVVTGTDTATTTTT